MKYTHSNSINLTRRNMCVLAQFKQYDMKPLTERIYYT